MKHQEPLEADEINLAIESGGEQYWHRIYRTYFPALTIFISRDFGPLPQDIAEDLASKALLKLVNGARKPRFDHRQQFISWLYKAARTTALDYWRTLEGKKRRETDHYDCADDLVIQVPGCDDPQGPDDDIVREVLEQLDERERTLLIMRADGTPYQVIACEIGVGENAARTYFNRAKKRFVALYTKMTGTTAYETESETSSAAVC